VAVAVHIRGHENDRDEGNRDYCDACRPQVRLPSETPLSRDYARSRLLIEP
jgi:hypothetical protein